MRWKPATKRRGFQEAETFSLRLPWEIEVCQITRF